jgi:hypothetical protein
MSIFHDLQDSYFDTIQLGEELEKIPLTCDCPQQMREAGTCCCSRSSTLTNSKRMGCLKHLQELQEKVKWFHEDLSESRRRSKEYATTVSSELFVVENFVHHLDNALRAIEAKLMQSDSFCFHDILKQLKEKTAQFQDYTTKLNQSL